MNQVLDKATQQTLQLNSVLNKFSNNGAHMGNNSSVVNAAANLTACQEFFKNVDVYMGPRHRVYKGMYEKPDMYGCDRELFMFNVMLFGGLSVLSLDLVVIVCCAIVGFINTFLLMIMGRHDMRARTVYLRQLRYVYTYKGHGTIHTIPCKRHRDRWF